MRLKALRMIHRVWAQLMLSSSIFRNAVVISWEVRQNLVKMLLITCRFCDLQGFIRHLTSQILFVHSGDDIPSLVGMEGSDDMNRRYCPHCLVIIEH